MNDRFVDWYRTNAFEVRKAMRAGVPRKTKWISRLNEDERTLFAVWYQIMSRVWP
jgi:hypothetical protein